MARGKKAVDSPVDRLRAFGLRYPGAHTKSPWPGHLDLAVKDKTFAYLSAPGEPLSISCKLPHSLQRHISKRSSRKARTLQRTLACSAFGARVAPQITQLPPLLIVSASHRSR